VDQAITRSPCAKCGGPFYQVKYGEPRCFPHSNDTRMNVRLQAKLRKDAEEAHAHLDRGFPPEAAWNDSREVAYGGRLLETPQQRLGLER
jgi:hypothetical protein